MIANVRGARPRTGTDAHLSASPLDTANRNHTPTSGHIEPRRPKNTSQSKPNLQFLSDLWTHQSRNSNPTRGHLRGHIKVEIKVAILIGPLDTSKS